MKILGIFGTRPEAIKMAPVIKALLQESSIELKVCVTAQHREMLDSVLQLFNIIPDFDLNLMSKNQNLSSLSSRILDGVTYILKKTQPDWVLVHGDTTTCFASALSAFYHQIPIAHVEAGLQTGNISLPFPEEANRRLVSLLAKLHFAPTSLAVENLIRNGVDSNFIECTGNTVIDALHLALSKMSNISDYWPEQLKSILASDNVRLLLITGHRRENYGVGLQKICDAVYSIAIKHSNLQIVYPVHLNPNVQKPVYQALKNLSNVWLLPPLDYLPFLALLKRSYIVLTDSGGIQEEAPSLGKPVLLMRDTTERPEGVEAGTVKLVGTDSQRIQTEVSMLLNNDEAYSSMSRAINPYGDGKAADRIVNRLLKNN